METPIQQGVRGAKLRRSQPTYKEWKRDPGEVVGGTLESSQPTYKEWKRP